MKSNLTYLLMAILLVTAGQVMAGDWKKVATLEAGGDAKEVQVERTVSKVAIKCTRGSVIINTLVVRRGGETTPHRVATRINQGDQQLVTIGEGVRITGLRISDSGDGTYEVRVR